MSGSSHESSKNSVVTNDVLREYYIIGEGNDSQDSSTSVSDVNDASNLSRNAFPEKDNSSTKVSKEGEKVKDKVAENKETTKETVVVKENPSAPTIISTIDKDTGFVDVNVFAADGKSATKEGLKPIICPRVNCPEKIVICLDLDEEVHTTIFRSRAGDKYSGLELAKRAMKMFVLHKSQIDPRHEFAFLVFQQESTMMQNFTNNPQTILQTLEDLDLPSQNSGPLNLAHLFETIKGNVTLPEIVGDLTVVPPAYVVRMLLVYGRSHEVPFGAGLKDQRELESSPHFFTDVLYIHEPPNETNKCEEIFHVLCDLEHNGLSYIFEQSKYTPILNSGAKLLAHPLQRPQQLQASYKIGNGPPMNPIAREEKVH